MALLVIRPGLSTTVQDRGRFGYRGFGVPVGGAFDRGSFDLANALLGNDPDAAALEMTLVGGTYRAEVDLAIALAGAPMSATIRSASGSDRRWSSPRRRPSRPAMSWSSAVRRSAPGPIWPSEAAGERPLCWPADRAKHVSSRAIGCSRIPPRPRLADLSIGPGPSRKTNEPIRVVDGPDAEPGDAQILESGDYRVSSQSNRMGLRLEGTTIDRGAKLDRVSASVAPGAIQIAGGQPIVLGVAGGTMGGYLHLAHVIAVDLDRVAQLRPGDRVTFRRIEIEDAQELDRLDRLERARWLTILRTQDSTQDSRTQD